MVAIAVIPAVAIAGFVFCMEGGDSMKGVAMQAERIGNGKEIEAAVGGRQEQGRLGGPVCTPGGAAQPVDDLAAGDAAGARQGFQDGAFFR